jgi:hypothetical protein
MPDLGGTLDQRIYITYLQGPEVKVRPAHRLAHSMTMYR